MKQKCGANIHINLQSAKQFCVKFSQKMKTPHFFFKSPHYFRKSPHCLLQKSTLAPQLEYSFISALSLELRRFPHPNPSP